MAFTPKTWYLISKDLADTWASLEEETNVRETLQLAKHYKKGTEEWYKNQIKELPDFAKKIEEVSEKYLEEINEKSQIALKKAIDLADNETIKAMREVSGISGDINQSKDKFLASAIQRFSNFNKGEMSAFISNATLRNNQFVNNIRFHAEKPELTNARVKSGMWTPTQGLYDTIKKQMEEGIKYGVPITYANGRKMPFKSHMEMSIRTTIQNEASNRMENATKALGIIFFLASEHADCADDHIKAQGKLYVNEDWGSAVLDTELREKIKELIALKNIQTVQWIKGSPVYFTTRPNCRHFLIPITIEQAFGNLNSLKSMLKTKKGSYLEENYNDLKKQRYNERAIRFYKERARTKIALYQKTDDPLLKADLLSDAQRDLAKVRSWQAKQRKLILSNDDLMREYRREDVNKMAQDLGVSLHLKSPKDLQKEAESGIIDEKKDDEQHGLIDTKTGEIVKTKIGQLNPQSLKGYTKKNGWYVDWNKLGPNVKIYGMVAEGSKKLQGLMAIEHKPDQQGTYLNWVVTAPHNNKQLTGGTQEFKGVGNLFIAKAAQESIKAGFGGYMYGFANTKETLSHYVNKWGAQHMPLLHDYQVIWDERTSQELIKKYKLEGS